MSDYGYACGCFSESIYEGSVLLIMGTWNYRIIKRSWYNKLHEEYQDMFDLCEVYYDENCDVDYITEAYITEHSIEDMRKTLQLMLDSLEKPIVNG